MPVLMFMNSMQVEVSDGTVLVFNPTSLTSMELNSMADVRFLVGGCITFQTKKDVLETIRFSPLNRQGAFKSETGHYILKYSDGMEFYPMIFDFMRRKYENKYAVLQTSQLPLEQLHGFKIACDYLLPGMFSPCVDENEKAAALASKELIRVNTFEYIEKEIIAAMKREDVQEFRHILLNKINRLAIGTYSRHFEIDKMLLQLMYDFKLTSARLEMITILFHPNEFGGRFFMSADGYCTIWTELVIRTMVTSQYKRKDRTLEELFAHLQMIIQHLVKNLEMPLKMTKMLSKISPCDEPQSLLDLTKTYCAWTAFAAFAPYFPELKDQHHLMSGGFLKFEPSSDIHEDFPFCVKLLLPYITSEELEMANKQLIRTLEHMGTCEETRHSEKNKIYYSQIFKETHLIIETARQVF